MHVIGTAGHVDHGKSSLIERLTGIDPDRLAEEKQRGLTIDLGFAWLTLPSGREAGIVDVPGHERFVHNMLAGVGSIDATIFVVAANEGWKPQSEEHLAILDLLGARAGVVALTKRDLIDDGLERVSEDIRAKLAGTALDGAEIVPVSSVSGDGIDDLLAALDAMLERTPESPDNGRARLFADRSFTMKGSGTVITGTLIGGRLRVDDEVEILPSGARARVRSIQTHKVRRDEATPGSRVALNLAGLDRHEVRRGDAIVRPGRWLPTNTLDVWMRPVRAIDHQVSGRGAFKVYIGSAEVDTRVRFIEPSNLAPDSEAFARLRLASPVVADAFDRFVLRDSGRGETVAGGVVLDAHPTQRRLTGAARERRVEELRARREAGREGSLDRLVSERGFVSIDEAERLAGVRPAESRIAGFAVSDVWLKEAAAKVMKVLDEHHAANPLTRGMQKDEARAGSGIDDAKLFSALIASMADRIAADGPLLRLGSHAVNLSPEQALARDRLVAELDAAGLQPPTLAELSHAHGASLVNALVDSGELVRFSPDYVLTAQRYESAKSAIAAAIGEEGSLTASRTREVLGTSRKYVIPFLEHLDAVGFTTRSGDLRTLTRRK
jgi:selenocysteine-specific elongation factor